MQNLNYSDVDKVRDVLSARSKNRKYIQGDSVVDFIAQATGFDRLIVIKCLTELKNSGEVSCQNWHRMEPVGRLKLNLRPPVTDSHLRWLRVLKKEGLREQDVESLEPLHCFIDDWDTLALSSLLKGLLALREDIPKLRGQSRYVVSARYLLGSSKIIDALPNAPLRAFGIDPTVLAKPPSYLMTAGPTNPEAVLLIENPQAFELAVACSIVDTMALVATFGYGLSRTSDDFGRQLASNIESNDPLVPLIRKGSPPDMTSLLSHPNMYFWGDLDIEGLRIFWRLRSKLPQLQLSAAYLPMIQLLKSEECHPYSKVSGKPNQKRWYCKDELVNNLLDLCTNRAVDQECIDSSKLGEIASKPLTMANADICFEC